MWAQRGYGRHRSKDVVDKEIVPDMARYLKEMKAMFKLGVECTAMDPRERPSMLTVLRRLTKLGSVYVSCFNSCDN